MLRVSIVKVLVHVDFCLLLFGAYTYALLLVMGILRLPCRRNVLYDAIHDNRSQHCDRDLRNPPSGDVAAPFSFMEAHLTNERALEQKMTAVFA